MSFDDYEFTARGVAHTHHIDEDWGIRVDDAVAVIEKAKMTQSFRVAVGDVYLGRWLGREVPLIYALPTGYGSLADDHTRERFTNLAESWESDTAFTSSVDAMVLHQNYQEIIGMGKAALPFIFERLHQSPASWFWALRAIVGFDVAEGAVTSEEAADKWYEWGAENGYVPVIA